MKILQLCHRLPYPPIDGGKISIYNFTRQYSARGHEVHLVVIAPDQERNVNLAPLRELARHCMVFYRDVDNRRSSFLANALCSRLPYNMTKYMSDEILGYIMSYLERTAVDCVHVDYLHMSHYAAAIKRRWPELPVILREHDVDSAIMGRLAANERNPFKRALYRSQAGRLVRYEREMLGRFDAILAITTEDRERIIALDRTLAGRTHVVPAGVDLSRCCSGRVNQTRVILHLASMDWLPNRQGLTWFLRSVFPKIVALAPDAKLVVAGRNMPTHFKRYRGPNVEVAGFVENPDDMFARCRLAVVPLWVGGGMRIKILNYMAAGIPIVSTSIGAEGITAENGRYLMIADDADEFARSVVTLLNDDEHAQRLVANGRSLVENEYSWPAAVSRTEKIIQEVVRRASAAPA
ncbi:MAG: glycosyltransferase [Candidatus Edwardsbacteria bacterium]|nr:glycosyltransferase [Candidatus Edwardsbacteria bacterium]